MFKQNKTETKIEGSLTVMKNAFAFILNEAIYKSDAFNKKEWTQAMTIILAEAIVENIKTGKLAKLTEKYAELEALIDG